MFRVVSASLTDSVNQLQKSISKQNERSSMINFSMEGKTPQDYDLFFYLSLISNIPDHVVFFFKLSPLLL